MTTIDPRTDPGGASHTHPAMRPARRSRSILPSPAATARHARMPRPRLSFAAFGLVLATACAEDPSFVLRWQVGRDAADAEKTLLSVRQCSELGLSRVRVTTFDRADNSEVDSREYPCFPEAFNFPEGTVAGPEIGAGEYDVTIVGLTRRGLIREDAGELLGRAEQTITVRASGEGQLVDGFRLVGISECDDGVDNDRDGNIDAADLACRQGETRESLDNSATLFTFQATLLGGNPLATCVGLGVTGLRVILDGVGAQRIPCTTVPQSFSAYLPPGTHTWAVEGLGVGDVAVTQAIAGPDAEFTVSSFGFGFVPIAVDLGIDSFLAPFNESLRFSVEYLPYEGAPNPRVCVEDAYEFGVLALGTTIVTLLDENGAAVDTVTLIDPKMDMDAAFPIVGTCHDFDSAHTTSELPWSAMAGQRNYSLTVETWAAADDPMVTKPCFSNAAAPTQLAPGINPSITVPRTRTDGTCADCTKNECDRCEDGVCKQG